MNKQIKLTVIKHHQQQQQQLKIKKNNQLLSTIRNIETYLCFDRSDKQ